MVEEWWEWWRSKQGTGKAGGVCPPPHSYSLSPLTFNDVLFVQNINVNRTVAEADLTDPGWGSTGQVQVRRGEAESDLDLTCTTSAGVARGSTLPTPLKSTKVKSRYNEAKPSCTWTWPRWTWAEVARGGRQVHRGAAEMYLLSPECNFSAMLMRRKASTSRRSRDVLVLPQNQHCIGVWWTPSTTSEHYWWGGGKYNEAQPSCTCIPTESTMLWSRRCTTECNSSAMLTRREASTPRRSRGVLVLSPSQHCARVGEVRLRCCSILY